MGAYVLYYHRIFPDEPASDVTLSLFEWEMSYLKKHYQVLSLTELIDYINGELVLDKPGVAITFDDGWFDNFVYAWPVLKKYDLKATIFVSTGKIRAENSVRHTMEDCWNGKANIRDLQRTKSVEKGYLESFSGNLGEFLTWEELRVMQKSGVFDIQSHGVEHRKVVCSENITGTAKGSEGWSVKSAMPDTKEGMPLYPIKSALSAKAYYPGSMQWETEQEMRGRILGELVQSRDRIASEIGIEPLHFCWPWGEYIETGIELAREAGYKACYTTKAGTVLPGADPYTISRVSSGKGKITFVKRGLIYSSPALSRSYSFLTGRK